MVKVDDKHLLVCNVAEGANKPYKNIDGDIFVKQGADKRRVTENTEILSLFQQSQKYFPDQEGVADSSAEDIDTLTKRIGSQRLAKISSNTASCFRQQN